MRRQRLPDMICSETMRGDSYRTGYCVCKARLGDKHEYHASDDLACVP